MSTTEDDVYATSALAFTLLVGDAPGPDAVIDPRLAGSASLPVAEAIRSRTRSRPLAASYRRIAGDDGAR
jgi:hypothetical protein